MHNWTNSIRGPGPEPMLIEKFACNASDKYGRTPLSGAAKGGQEAVVRLLTGRNDVDINASDNNGQTPLLWAAAKGHEVVVRLLIEKNDIDINASDRDGWTPLFWAARNGHEGTVQLLVDRDDVDVNAEDYIGQTALSFARQIGHRAVVRQLEVRVVSREAVQAAGTQPSLLIRQRQQMASLGNFGASSPSTYTPSGQKRKSDLLAENLDDNGSSNPRKRICPSDAI